MIDPNPFEYTPCPPINTIVRPPEPKQRRAVYVLYADDMFVLTGCVAGLVVSNVVHEPFVMRQLLWWVSVLSAVFVFWRSRRIEEM